MDGRKGAKNVADAKPVPKNEAVALKKGKQYLEIISAYGEGDKA